MSFPGKWMEPGFVSVLNEINQTWGKKATLFSHMKNLDLNAYT